MSYLLSYLWTISISGLLVMLFRKRFEYTTVFAYLLGTFVLYGFAFINKIRWGFYLSWVFVAAFWMILLYWNIQKEKEKTKEFLENFITPGFYAFALLFIYVIILNQNKGFTYCDEFTHWGPMVVATLKCNGFYAQSTSILTFHQDYPPLFTLLQVLFSGFHSFSFSETTCYMALETFGFACFLPVFANLKSCKKDIFKTIVLVFSVVLVGITISITDTAQENAYFYNSIYTDYPLALFAAFLFYMVYKEKDWNTFGYFFLSVGLISLLLMKQIGICFTLVLLLYAFIKMIFIDKKKDRQSLIKAVLFFIGIPVFGYYSWQYIVNLYDLEGQFMISELDFSSIVDIVSGSTSQMYKHEAFVNFLDAIQNRILVTHPINMSYFGYVLVSILIVGFIVRKKRQIIVMDLVLVIGAVGYAFTIMLLYMLAYDITEAPVLASFDRYMSTYLFLMNCLMFFIATNKISEAEGKKSCLAYLVVFAAVLLFVEPGSFEDLLPGNRKTVQKVLVIDQNDVFDVNREEVNGLVFEFEELGYVEKGYISATQFKELLKEYDLLYISLYDRFIDEDLWTALDVDAYLWNDSLYIINSDGEELSLIEQGNQFYEYVMRYYLLDK